MAGPRERCGDSVSVNSLMQLRKPLSPKMEKCAILHPAVPAEGSFMAYQRGCLKKVRRKEGETWVLRFRVTSAEGNRVEHTLPVGLVEKFPKDKDAWREVDRLGLGVRINDAPRPGRASFEF